MQLDLKNLGLRLVHIGDLEICALGSKLLGKQYRTMVSRPSCTGFNPQHTQNSLRKKNVAVAEVNQRPCLEESGQWLENGD